MVCLLKIFVQVIMTKCATVAPPGICLCFVRGLCIIIIIIISLLGNKCCAAVRVAVALQGS